MVSLEDIKRRHEAALLRIDGVRGVALGRDRVIVYVEVDSAVIRAALPRDLEGVSVEIVVSGRFRARTR